MDKFTAQEIATRVAALTDENDHWTAIMTVAQEVPAAKKELKSLSECRAVHWEAGYLKEGLYEKREALSKRVMELAATQFSAADMEMINAAF